MLGKLHRGVAEGAEGERGESDGPGEGWRWLRDDEVRAVGDEVEDLSGKWWPVAYTVGALQNVYVARCRRRVGAEMERRAAGAAENRGEGL